VASGLIDASHLNIISETCKDGLGNGQAQPFKFQEHNMIRHGLALVSIQGWITDISTSARANPINESSLPLRGAEDASSADIFN
jgi:hypothetical protein